jgi:hypothetical protein
MKAFKGSLAADGTGYWVLGRTRIARSLLPSTPSPGVV